MEFLFGTNPAVASPGPVLQTGVDPDSLRLSFQLPHPVRAGVNLGVERASSLEEGTWIEVARRQAGGGWTSADGVEIEGGEVADGVVMFHVDVPLPANSPGGPMFVRLVASEG